MTSSVRPNHGFSLIELMIALAIIGIISAVALPAYNGYIQTARQGVLTQNIDTMRIFQEDYRLRTGSYFEGEWIPGGAKTLETTLGWNPNQDGVDVQYAVTDADATTYTVTATDNDANITVSRTFP